MDRMIWTAMSGMTDSSVRQRVIANNMANAQTIGFRAETVYSTPVTLKGAPIEARALIDGEVHGANMTPGAIVPTGRVSVTTYANPSASKALTVAVKPNRVRSAAVPWGEGPSNRCANSVGQPPDPGTTLADMGCPSTSEMR